jgi:NAD(P)-dependent dehydrogenase (short-subunit alcohol dehydrogenase family)
MHFIQTLFLTLSATALATTAFTLSMSATSRKVAVFGGTGFVGSAVCERLIKKGYDVTAVSRRGTNPKPNDSTLSQVNWVQGNALDKSAVKKIVNENDAVVHAIGLLFDVNSGLEGLNKIVSGSGSLPDDSSTYDNITRQTMFNICEAIEGKIAFPSLGKKEKYPLCFVSCAEAGWPDVAGGSFIEEKLAPDWLKGYLAAKRAVEERLSGSTKIRAAIYRPSLIWDWTKVSTENDRECIYRKISWMCIVNSAT